MDNYLQRVLISFGLDLLNYMENLNVMMLLSAIQWKVCPLCLHAKPEQQVQAAHDLLSAYTYRTCSVCLPDMSSMAEAAEQQAVVCKDAQDRWQPSDESTSVSHDTHHLSLMAKKSKKKSNKKDQEKEKAQVDDQDESDVEVKTTTTLIISTAKTSSSS